MHAVDDGMKGLCTRGFQKKVLQQCEHHCHGICMCGSCADTHGPPLNQSKAAATQKMHGSVIRPAHTASTEAACCRSPAGCEIGHPVR